MKVLIIDNFDSFTYNLYQYIGEILQNTSLAFGTLRRQGLRCSTTYIPSTPYSASQPFLALHSNAKLVKKESCSQNFVVDVVRNNEITVAEIRKRNYNRIVISPGPGSPERDAYFGVCGEVLTKLGKEIPVLGVCLGMQGMAYCFGGKVVRAKKPMHGKTSLIKHDGKGVFIGLPQDLEVMRYHSLVVERKTLPECLEISAISQDTDEIMGLRHKKYQIEGIQFHPESFGTEGGKKMLENFILEYRG